MERNKWIRLPWREFDWVESEDRGVSNYDLAVGLTVSHITIYDFDKNGDNTQNRIDLIHRTEEITCLWPNHNIPMTPSFTTDYILTMGGLQSL